MANNIKANFKLKIWERYPIKGGPKSIPKIE
jgi:hypothetical protein